MIGATMHVIIITSPPNWLVQQGIQNELEKHFEQPGPHDHKCFLFRWGTAMDTIFRSPFRPAVEAILN